MKETTYPFPPENVMLIYIHISMKSQHYLIWNIDFLWNNSSYHDFISMYTNTNPIRELWVERIFVIYIWAKFIVCPEASIHLNTCTWPIVGSKSNFGYIVQPYFIDVFLALFNQYESYHWNMITLGDYIYPVFVDLSKLTYLHCFNRPLPRKRPIYMICYSVR